MDGSSKPTAQQAEEVSPVPENGIKSAEVSASNTEIASESVKAVEEACKPSVVNSESVKSENLDQETSSLCEPVTDESKDKKQIEEASPAVKVNTDPISEDQRGEQKGEANEEKSVQDNVPSELIVVENNKSNLLASDSSFVAPSAENQQNDNKIKGYITIEEI